MNILRPGAVVGGLLLSSPTMYSSLVTETTGVDAAIFRFLFGVLLTGVGLSLIDAIAVAYAVKNDQDRAKPPAYTQGRRASDLPPAPAPMANPMDLPALEPAGMPMP
ncbi:hypothetical protein [Motilibacter deserti]|uniref:Uncharacterized protein n=1 Tax=Motilibacter deserti TaxID=2714956 RepID=A0ABX0GX38_9ACTN|nr:hypothetical protein [Motilibacter deserti]NHC15128.1 hypothetical protein [Motilibacter deserti]